MTFFLSFVALACAGLALVGWQAATARRRRAAFLDGYRFPDSLRDRVRARYPQLADADLDRVFDGLRAWFRLAHTAGRRPLAMPSQAVDLAWHEFILFTRNYAHFCRQALGRFLHHTPAEAMRTPTDAQEGIRRAWRLACAQEGIDPRDPQRLPRLFALDAELRIPDGFRYALNCAALVGAARAGSPTYCGAHIGCGSGGGDGGCSSDSGCGGDGGGGGCGGD